jgi:uncharacterized protein (DUF1501 family)
MTTRRQFIQSTFAGTALVSLSHDVPEVLLRATRPVFRSSDERILVVIQLGGGNDGLNTVIPYGDDAYYENRFTLAINKSAVLKIDDHVGLHPSLKGFAEMLEQKRLAIVQGVGYPNPNRSHFESMDLWHSAHRISESQQLGWIGRCLDAGVGFPEDLPAVHYGEGRQPLALGTRGKPVPSITSLDQFRLNVADRKSYLKQLTQDLATPRPEGRNELLGYIHQSAGVALKTSQRIEGVLENSRTAHKYPTTRLGKKLAAISQLIDSGLSTRVYYLTHDGFDTHSNQAAAHASLLQELGDAMLAFTNDLAQRGHGQRTVIFSFSEFGRRVRENASRGTDHGTAAPVFVVGGAVSSGLLNLHPSLTDLEEGDLKFAIDYRQVYATLLEKWLGIASPPILGDRFETIKLFV